MEKKKVLLINRNLSAGGIETSLLSFVDNLKDFLEIDVMLFSNDGILKNKLSKEVRIIEGGRILRLMHRDNQGKEGASIKKQTIIGKLKKFFRKSIGKIVKIFAFCGTRNKKDYDMVICFNGLDYYCAKYAKKYTKSKLKFTMIHNDISQINVSKRQLKLISSFDKIVCVSNSCSNIFKKKYPLLDSKVDYIYNFQNCEEILGLAQEFNVEYAKGKNFITVARLSEEKAHLRTLNALKRIKDEGLQFTWHLVGEGVKRKDIEEFIKTNNMNEYVILHGNQKNPYPYIKPAEFLFIGSYNEAAPMVYAEAMCLGVPIITTRTSSADELVGERGLICENSEDGIYKVLRETLNNLETIRKKRNYLVNYETNSKLMIEKILGWCK